MKTSYNQISKAADLAQNVKLKVKLHFSTNFENYTDYRNIIQSLSINQNNPKIFEIFEKKKFFLILTLHFNIDILR